MRLNLLFKISFGLLTLTTIAHAELKVVTERRSNLKALPPISNSKPFPLLRKVIWAEKAVCDNCRRRTRPKRWRTQRPERWQITHRVRHASRELFLCAGRQRRPPSRRPGREKKLTAVNSYSWHPDTRGPQVYKLYASDGTTEGFNAKPKGVAPESCGWKLLANVDCRTSQNESGGQYGVSISDSTGSLGEWRYLLFAIQATESDDPFGNTFYSEIDLIDGESQAVAEAKPEERVEQFTSADGKYHFKIETTETPDLTEWAHQKLVPMATDGIPAHGRDAPSEGYEAPTNVTILFLKDMQGVANTSGTKIRCAGRWFKNNLQGEAVGAVYHELVHVVQQYGWGRRNNPGATRTPGWLQEGIPDYIRWFKFEPQSHGADLVWMSRQRREPKYDASYRYSANFLDWVINKYDPSCSRN